MRMQQWFVRVFGVAVGGLLLAGCGPTLPLPFLAKSAQDLASSGSQSFAQSKVVRLKGQFTSRDPYQVDLTMSRSGDGGVSGSGVSGSAPFKVMVVGNKTYIQGQAYWQKVADGDEDQLREARAFGDKWVVARGTSLSLALLQLRDLGGLASQLQEDSKRVKKGKETSLDGQKVVPLTDGATTYYVTQSSPNRLVRVVSQSSGSSLRDVKLDVDYNAQLHVSTLSQGQFVDPDDPSTLPARYSTAGPPEFVGCDSDSPACGLKVSVENEAGPPQGQSVAVLTVLKEDDRTPIGACNAPIPAVENNQTASVSCNIDGNAWNAFKQAVNGSTTIHGHVDIKNPPYDT